MAVTLPMRTLALVATILMVAAGCDKKQRDDAAQAYVDFIDKVSGVADKGKPLPPAYTNLGGEPPVLFQVFGRRSDPRMIPLAGVQQGKLRRIVLNGRGWRDFQRQYASPGDSLLLFRDGQTVGAVTVRRGMWNEADSAVYTLPGCTLPLPLSHVSLHGPVSGSSVAVDALASNRPLGRATEPVTLSRVEVQRTGRDIGLLVGGKLGMSPEMIDSLDANSMAIPTGRPGKPTLLINLLDPAVSDSSRARKARQVFVVADAGPFGYGPTYWHFQRGTSGAPQFRRYIDHLDVDGDGLDELLLEAWFAGRRASYIVVLGQRPDGAGWEERYRTDPDWCQDKLFVGTSGERPAARE